MSLSKKDQDRLEAALSDRSTKEKLLDEIQAMRDAYNALLAKLDADHVDVGGASTEPRGVDHRKRRWKTRSRQPLPMRHDHPTGMGAQQAGRSGHDRTREAALPQLTACRRSPP